MNLKKSWVNVPLLKNILKQNTLLAKISLIAVISFSIMGIVGGGALRAISYVLFGLSAIILTTCYAGFVQKYMTRKNEANFVASLPIDSFVLWFTHYLAGLVLVIIPLCIESVLLVWLSFDYLGPGGGLASYVFTFPIATVLLVIIYYTISFFVSCMAGNRFGQFIYTVVFYALPFLLYVAINGGGQLLSIGNVDTFNSNIMGIFMPLTSGLSFISDGTWNFAIWHFLVTTAFFIGGYYIFKNRSIENTGEALLYKKMNMGLRVVLVVTVTILVFIVLANVLGIISNYHINAILLGAGIFIVLGSLFALSVELVFKNNHIYKSLLYYVPVFIVAYASCYLYGQYTLNTMQDRVYANEDVILTIEYHTSKKDIGLKSRNEMMMKTKEAKKIIAAIQSKPQKIIKTNMFVTENNRDYALVRVANMGDDIYNTDSFYIEVDIPYIDKVLEEYRDIFKTTIDEETIKQIENNDQEYWYLDYYNNMPYSDNYIEPYNYALAVLTKKEVLDMVDYMQSDAYLKEENVLYNNYLLKNKTDQYIVGVSEKYIDILYQNEVIYKRLVALQQCLQIVNPYESQNFDQITALSPILKKIVDSNQTISCDEINHINDVTIIDDSFIKVNVTYRYYDEAIQREITNEFIITFEVQGEKVKVIKVEGGETDVVAI